MKIDLYITVDGNKHLVNGIYNGDSLKVYIYIFLLKFFHIRDYTAYTISPNQIVLSGKSSVENWRMFLRLMENFPD